MKNKDTQQLGISVYIHALKKQIEKEVESRYTERIEYLVGANNELMKELEQWERVGKRLENPPRKTATGSGLSIAAYSEKKACGIR